MNREQLKSVIRECLEEVLVDQSLLMSFVSEAIKTSVTTILAEVTTTQTRAAPVQVEQRQQQQAPAQRKAPTGYKPQNEPVAPKKEAQTLYEQMAARSAKGAGQALLREFGNDAEELERSREMIKQEARNSTAKPKQSPAPEMQREVQKIVQESNGFDIGKFMAKGGINKMANVLSNASIWEDEEKPATLAEQASDIGDDMIFGAILGR